MSNQIATTPIDDVPTKHPGGRPVELTPEKSKILIERLSKGDYLETAASLAGINRHTIRNWCRAGRRIADSEEGPQTDEERSLVSFLDAVEKALAKGESKDWDKIGAASKGQWQASAWRLERRYPEKYGQRPSAVGAINGKLEIVVTHKVMGAGEQAPAIDITPETGD